MVERVARYPLVKIDYQSHPFRMLNVFRAYQGFAPLRSAQPLATFFHPFGVILSLMPMRLERSENPWNIR